MEPHPPFVKLFLMCAGFLLDVHSCWASHRHNSEFWAGAQESQCTSVCLCVHVCKNLSPSSTDSPQRERKINQHTQTKLSGSKLEAPEVLYKALEAQGYQ